MRKVAIVTGAAGGIGRATVAAFISDWTVIAVDREWATDISEATTRTVNLSEEREVQALFEWLENDYGRLDALVNNAAVQVRKPLVDTTIEEWNDVLNSNLRSIYLTTRYAQPLLQASHGAIVNISSVHAMATSAGSGAYAASKGGVSALTRASALELTPVRVNAILPGAIDTHMLRSNLEHADVHVDDSIESLGARTALGRVGQPEDIAQAILFLADSERSSYITGSSLVVDGGALARLSIE